MQDGSLALYVGGTAAGGARGKERAGSRALSRAQHGLPISMAIGTL